MRQIDHPADQSGQKSSKRLSYRIIRIRGIRACFAVNGNEIANSPFRFRPNPTARPQPLEQSAVVRNEDAYPMIGEPRPALEILNLCKECVGHEGQYARLSV